MKYWGGEFRRARKILYRLLQKRNYTVILIIRRPFSSTREYLYNKKNLDVSSIICVCQFRDYVCLNRSRGIHMFLDINIISGFVSLSFVFVCFFFIIYTYIWKEKVMEFVHASSISGFPGSCKTLEEMSS